MTPYASGDYNLVLDDDSAQARDIATPRDRSGGRSVPFSGMAAQPPGGEDMGRFDLSGCELRAALPGHRSNLIALGPRRRLDKPVVAQLVLQRLADGVGPVFTPNTLAAPRQARDALVEAWTQLQKAKPDHRRAVGEIELATMEAQQERWRESATLIARVQQLNPDIPYANYLSASAHFHLGQMDVAEESALAVYDTPDLERYPLIYYILGAIQAQRGDSATAVARFRQFPCLKPDPATAAAVRDVLADWEREGRLKTAP